MSSQEPIPSMFSERSEKLGGKRRWIKRIWLAASLLTMCTFIMGQARPSREARPEKQGVADGIEFKRNWITLGMPEEQALSILRKGCQITQTGVGTYAVLPRSRDCFGFVVFKGQKLAYANKATSLAGFDPVSSLVGLIVTFTDTYKTSTCTLDTSLGKGPNEFHAFIRCGSHSIHMIDSPSEKSVSEELGELPND